MSKIFCQYCKENRSMKVVDKVLAKNINKAWRCNTCKTIHVSVAVNGVQAIKQVKLNLESKA